MTAMPGGRVAALERENAELRRQLDEALAQQAATAEVLQVINSSPGDLAPVFDAMLEKALRLCDAVHGGLYGYGGEVADLLATRGEPAFVNLVRSRGPFRPGKGPLSEVLTGEPVVQVVDAQASEAYRANSGYRALVDAGDIRTNLIVALRKDEAVVGAIAVFRQEVRPFSDKQIALLQNFAAQAVIAMENVRLLTETRSALDQQTATAEVLQVINSSPGDLAPVFDAILEKAHTLCQVDHGSLQLYDGETYRAVAIRGAVLSVAEQLRRPRRPDPNLSTYRLFAGEPFVHVPDLAEVDAPGRTIVKTAGVRTVLYVALRKEETVLGFIGVGRKEVRPFSDKQIALLQNFAAQAVIAMENARLITETREALDRQIATAEVLQVINSSPGDLAPVFEAMLEKAHDLCGADHGHLTIYDGDQFRTVAAHNVPEAFNERLRQPFRPGHDFAERMLAGERLIHVPDMAALTPRQDDDIARGGVEIADIRTLLFVPLRRDSRLLGYITAHRQEVRPFSDKQIALLENFAAQAVIAIENARLLGELRRSTDEVAGLNRDLEARVAAQVEELGRVGRLKRFLAPQLAELIVSQGDEKILESHRREIVVVFCDLRGYTAFTETAEPEEVLDFLREYHGALGPLVARFEGTLDQFSGDGIMVFFNDPVPIPDPAERAVEMATAMREAARSLAAAWRRRGRELGFGVGIAQGYATLGQIGFSERSGYTAIGTVCNVAARLCGEAKDGQILLSQRVAAGLDGTVALEEVGALTLKGLTQPVVAFNVVEPGGGAGRLRLV